MKIWLQSCLVDIISTPKFYKVVNTVNITISFRLVYHCYFAVMQHHTNVIVANMIDPLIGKCYEASGYQDSITIKSSTGMQLFIYNNSWFKIFLDQSALLRKKNTFLKICI